MECVPTGVLSLGIDNLYYGVHIFVEYMYTLHVFLYNLVLMLMELRYKSRILPGRYTFYLV